MESLKEKIDMNWKKEYVDVNHKHWNKIISRALREVETLQYRNIKEIREQIIQFVEQNGRLKTLIKYKIVVDFIDDIQSSFEIFKIEENVK